MWIKNFVSFPILIDVIVNFEEVLNLTLFSSSVGSKLFINMKYYLIIMMWNVRMKEEKEYWRIASSTKWDENNSALSPYNYLLFYNLWDYIDYILDICIPILKIYTPCCSHHTVEVVFRCWLWWKLD